MRRNPLLNGWFILVIFSMQNIKFKSKCAYRFYSHSQTSMLACVFRLEYVVIQSISLRTLSRNKPKKRTRRVKKHEGKNCLSPLITGTCALSKSEFVTCFVGKIARKLFLFMYLFLYISESCLECKIYISLCSKFYNIWLVDIKF